MPQMAPLNWLILFFMFIMIYLMFNLINYYSFFYSTKPNTLTITKKLMNWKW
uniref:ATP synthase complex subunit 8 n=1 Tax=Sunius melanocephalus TaxID=1588492 RepID=A0A0S2M9A0_9COLE|nr:ATP synthase F0 subunit 8 [Sunius melanocephalus]